MLGVSNSNGEASMSEVGLIGIDLAKRVFQLQGAGSDGSVLFRKGLSRSRVLPSLKTQVGCIIALEACVAAHNRGRRTGALGHGVMLIPPVCAKHLWSA